MSLLSICSKIIGIRVDEGVSAGDGVEANDMASGRLCQDLAA